MHWELQSSSSSGESRHCSDESRERTRGIDFESASHQHERSYLREDRMLVSTDDNREASGSIHDNARSSTNPPTLEELQHAGIVFHCETQERPPQASLTVWDTYPFKVAYRCIWLLVALATFSIMAIVIVEHRAWRSRAGRIPVPTSPVVQLPTSGPMAAPFTALPSGAPSVAPTMYPTIVTSTEQPTLRLEASTGSASTGTDSPSSTGFGFGSVNLFPAEDPLSARCFESTAELRAAVRSYLQDNSSDTSLAQTYGHPINAWCVDRLTDFSSVFYNTVFNEPINQWNVSRATSFDMMFASNPFFDQALPWDTSRATSMTAMFHAALSFNQPLPWDTGKVVAMSHMFAQTQTFSQPLEFDTAKVKSMAAMFADATAFDNELSFSSTSKVETMDLMFYHARSFQGDLPHFDTSAVTTMDSMFLSSSFHSNSIAQWNVSRVRNFHRMFESNKVFNVDLSSWHVGSSRNFDRMFQGATSFRQDLCAWGPLLRKAGLEPARMPSFYGTNCSQNGSPNLFLDPPTPLCFTCSAR